MSTILNLSPFYESSFPSCRGAQNENSVFRFPFAEHLSKASVRGQRGEGAMLSTFEGALCDVYLEEIEDGDD